MNTFFVLQAAAGQQAGSNWSFLLMMVAIFGVMYFFMIRPQQKKQKEIEKFRNSLKKGDKVVTIGGIYGTVAEIKEKYVLVEVDANVKLRIDKSAIVKDMSDVPAK
ncbi:MAG: preprotein translocase subunit YajC [Bacteroidales bacterium]|jgi:preprotein translocase subunit YajC|nr:preprotein translocase subunit YajC [Bacteroidales bacterium]MBQ1219431.1 preprotein translocase subunit YajC [Bacteroidales bacterium]MBQ1929182.1 preprotein translocase subunit YajC [Bacteroidales bacterium]MBQ5784259.1 preprotein translocase subunit YajC [Bacteroidales bacterium]MBR6541075.1 preprotein translocase subunit YajC [Bacteroidales bacterium]